MNAGLIGAATLAALLVTGAAAGTGAAGTPEKEATHALTTMINQQIRAEGSFFTPKEQQIIIAKCGYAPGEWNTFDANMTDGVFVCTNGRRIDDPEMKAVMAAASPRIKRRVNEVMARPEVRDAIHRVAVAAEAAAMRRLEERRSR